MLINEPGLNQIQTRLGNADQVNAQREIQILNWLMITFY